MVKILLDAQANTTITSQQGKTAYDIARKKNNTVIIDLLLQPERRLTKRREEEAELERKIQSRLIYQKRLDEDLTKIEFIQKKKELEQRELERMLLNQNFRGLQRRAKIRLQPELDTILALEIRDLVERLNHSSLGFTLQTKAIYKFRDVVNDSQRYKDHIGTLSSPSRTRQCFYGNSVESISEVIMEMAFSPSKFLNETEGMEGRFGYGSYFTTDANASALHCGDDRFLLYCEVRKGPTELISLTDG